MKDWLSLAVDVGILLAVIYLGYRALHIEQKEWDYEGDIKLLRKLVKIVERIEKRLIRSAKKKKGRRK